MCGTPLYMAPEVHEGKVYDSKVDMYSFGLVMWEMWFGERATLQLSSRSHEEVSFQIEEKKHRNDRRGVTFYAPPGKWIELMVFCWDYEPCVRKTATESIALMEKIQQLI